MPVKSRSSSTCCGGRTNREIAQCLDIGEKTVKHYMTVLMQKLDVRNRVEVVLAAQKIGSSPDLLN
ncbi:response regulator transcription factor [Pararhizobium sp. DWP1-1-3]|uniref:response regulator transcription factor n=1 Tax=Pararhizobium sp. DWP1-1-3 TaxID=2804652 RepID=UPI003CF5E289